LKPPGLIKTPPRKQPIPSPSSVYPSPVPSSVCPSKDKPIDLTEESETEIENIEKSEKKKAVIEEKLIFEEVEISLCEYLMQHISSSDVESLARLLGNSSHILLVFFFDSLHLTMYLY
jgi:hypothetical protein